MTEFFSKCCGEIVIPSDMYCPRCKEPLGELDCPEMDKDNEFIDGEDLDGDKDKEYIIHTQQRCNDG